MWRGFLGKCSSCGKGSLFGRFLKVTDQCERCGEDFHHQRADDLPAYLVIIVVGHSIVPAILAVEMAYAPPAWLQLAIWLPVPVVNQLRTYWWCSPPRTGRQRMVPASLTARETGASFSKDKCVLISL
jgi:uncharacterized protein (DUF983 family)